MNGVTFSQLSLGGLAIIAMFFWIADFFAVFKKSILFVPKAYHRKKINIARTLLFIVGIIAWLFIIFASFGPRKPLGSGKTTIEVNDIFVVLDLSRSMLADDLKPNRVEGAKKQIKEFVQLHPTDRIGIVTFAEKAFTLLPLSTDLNLIAKLVGQIQIGGLGDGTNIGDAIALAVGRLMYSQAKNKIIILLTDGVSNVGTMTPIQAAEMAVENKIKIYSIGIGSDKDARIPIGQSFMGGVQYQTIPGGSVDEKTLNEISRLTNAKFYMAGNNSNLKKILSEINQLEKTKIEKSAQVIYEELFYKYLLIGLMLLMVCELARKIWLKEGA